MTNPSKIDSTHSARELRHREVDDTPPHNPRVPRFLRWVTAVEAVVVGWAALLLLVAPMSFVRETWAWEMLPFNARFVGAVYAAALPPLVVFAISGRWVPGRLVLWMIGTFTTVIMLVMLSSVGEFELARLHTWVFFALYCFLPVNSAVFLHRTRGLAAPHDATCSRLRATVFSALAIVLGGYGVALLLDPVGFTGFWPWPIDAFHGRIYAATFLTPAAGAWVIRHRATAVEDATLALTFLTFGLVAPLALLLANADVPVALRVGAGDSIAYLAMNAAIFGAGVALAARWLATRSSRS